MGFDKTFNTVMKSEKITNDNLSKLLEERYGYKIGKDSIGKYRRGERTPNPEFIKFASKILNIPTDYLLGVNNKITLVKKIPIIGTASCGKTNNNHLQDSTSFAYYNGDYYKPSLYCVIANGDSMAPEIEDGDEVICDPDADVQNGDIVHYKIGAESAIKVYVKDEDAYMVQFIPYNSSEDFKTKTIRLDDDIAKELEINKVVAVNKLKFNNRLSRLKLIGRA